jgi:acetoin utilization protein AcuC
MKKAVFIYSSELEKYHYPPDHPFNTSRARITREIISSTGLLSESGRSEVPPEPAERIVLKRFHSARYLHALKEAAEGRWLPEVVKMGLGTSDCPVFEGLYEYSVLAAGGTVKAVRMILAGQADIAFNPSGGFHHAHPERASGFCYINDVAIACTLFAEAGKRVLYLDVDVHHGDGVAYAFYDRCDVMTISLHENPRVLFPGTGFEDEIGQGQGMGYCVNIPLPVGTYDEAYMKAFESVAPPLIRKFDPDVFVFELGADALGGDPLAHLCLTNNVYAEIIEHLLGYDRPLLTTGGGGYDVENTARAWALAWSALTGADQGPGTNIGAGGVMLASTDWEGGLRDRTLVISDQQRRAVEPAVDAVIERVKANIFPLHELAV